MMFFSSRMANIAPLWQRLGATAGLLLALTSQTPAAPPSTAVSPNQPNILMLVYVSPDGQDTVGLTYPTAIPHTKAKGDVQALASSAGWVPSNVDIEDAPAPIIGSKDMMTSVDFQAHVVEPSAKYLPLEPVVLALKNYPHVAITYMVANNYSFEGLRNYSDKYVSIALDAHGNAYTYHIFVHDPKFQKLNLPLYQPPAAPQKTAEAPARRRVHPWQVMLVTVIACLAGGCVYFAMSRNTPA